MSEEKKDNELLPGGSSEEAPAREKGKASDKKPYDKAVNALITECPELLIPLTNELFGLKLRDSMKVTLLAPGSREDPVNPQSKVRITDAYYQVGDPSKPSSYHLRFLLEFETKGWSNVPRRVLQYGFQKSMEEMNEDEQNKDDILDLPGMGVVAFRGPKPFLKWKIIWIRIPVFHLRMPCPIVIRTMKHYTVREMKKKRLFILVPFWIFTFPELGKRDQDLSESERKKMEARAAQMWADYDELIRWVGESAKEREDGSQPTLSANAADLITNAAALVLQAYTEPNSDVKKEVENMVLAEDWEFPAVIRTRALAAKDQELREKDQKLRDKDQKLMDKDKTMSNLRKAFFMKEDGYSAEEIATELKVDTSVVEGWLSRDE